MTSLGNLSHQADPSQVQVFQETCTGQTSCHTPTRERTPRRPQSPEQEQEPGLSDDVFMIHEGYRDNSDTTESAHGESARLRNLEQTVQAMAEHIQVLGTHLRQ